MILFLRRKITQTKLQYTFTTKKTWLNAEHSRVTAEGMIRKCLVNTVTDRHSSTEDRAKI